MTYTTPFQHNCVLPNDLQRQVAFYHKVYYTYQQSLHLMPCPFELFHVL
jgi:hypothetical protein